MPTPYKAPSWSEKIVEPFRSAPKKSATLGGLTLLLALLWIKTLTGTHAPSAAQAAAPADMRVPDPSADPITLVHRPAAQIASIQQWAHESTAPVRRNLFAVPFDYYPRDGVDGGDTTNTNSGFWDQLAKSMSAQADQQEQRQILVENIRTKAAALQLQSTMMGGQPTAMVNGEMVRPDSIVAGFRVLTIEAHRIVVEREGIKLEILMK